MAEIDDVKYRIQEEDIPFWIARDFTDKHVSPLENFIDVFVIDPDQDTSYQIEYRQNSEIIRCTFIPELFNESLFQQLGHSLSMRYSYADPIQDQEHSTYHLFRLMDDESSSVRVILETLTMEFDNKLLGYITIIRTLLIQLLVLLTRSNSQCQMVNRPSNELARRINNYLERSYDEKITIPKLSELFGISNRQLNRVFKAEIGATVVERIHDIRIRRAKQLLLETNDKIIEIANRVGYEDPAFFSRLFHRLMGCPPGKYRKQNWGIKFYG